MHASTPVIVGVDGSERAVDALALADVLGPALTSSLVIAFVHPHEKLSSLLSEGEYERLVREVADATFDQVRENLPSVSERRMQLVAEDSAAAGLHALAAAERAALIVVGSSHRSRIGQVLAGGTGERLLSGAPAPVAIAPAGYAAAKAHLRVVGCGFDGSPESQAALEWAATLARAASAQLRVVGVHEPTLAARVALGGGLATTSLNDVLRRQRQEELADAVSRIGGLAVSGELLDGGPAEVLARESRELDLLVVGSRGYGPLRAVLLGGVSAPLVRSAESPLVVIPRGAGEEGTEER